MYILKSMVILTILVLVQKNLKPNARLININKKNGKCRMMVNNLC